MTSAKNPQRLLVSVRGPSEAIAAARGGAHIADVEYPASALGSPYPLNIKTVKERLATEGFGDVAVSTNIGEDQPRRSTACQAALGVALAGADLVKFGLAGLDPKGAAYVGKNIVRSVREWFPERGVFPAVFPEEEFRTIFDPVHDGSALVDEIQADGLLIDTYHKDIGRGLLDYLSVTDLERAAEVLHDWGKELWVAGSVTHEELPGLWGAGVDVVCVRGAACANQQVSGRFGEVTSDIVRRLVETIPSR